MNAKSSFTPGKPLSEQDIARHSSLLLMPNAQAIDEMLNTLLEFSVYCKTNKLDFLNYLIEMAALEAKDVQSSLQTGKQNQR